MADTYQPIFFTESSKNLGGQELQLIQQMIELEKRSIKTILFCRENSAVFSCAQQNGLTVVPTHFRNAADIQSLSMLLKYLLMLRPAAVICHSGHDAIISALSVKIFRCISPLTKTRVIRMRTYQPGIPGAVPYNYLFDMTYTPSNYLRSQLLANPKIKARKIGVLLPGIDFTRLDSATLSLPADLITWIMGNEGPLLVHGAMLRAEKGHQIILSALKTLKNVFPDIRYLIVGDGPLRQELERIVEAEQLTHHVRFAGFLPNIGNVLRYATLAVFPSTYEPLGMFQIESQYLGVPTIASNIGGIPETIQDGITGHLVPSDDPAVWHRAIIQVLTNSETQMRYRNASREFVEKRFSVDTNTSRLIAICYESVGDA